MQEGRERERVCVCVRVCVRVYVCVREPSLPLQSHNIAQDDAQQIVEERVALEPAGEPLEEGFSIGRCKQRRGEGPGRQMCTQTQTDTHRHRQTHTDRHTDAQTHRHTDVQTHRHRNANTQTHRNANTQTHRCTDTDVQTPLECTGVALGMQQGRGADLSSI